MKELKAIIRRFFSLRRNRLKKQFDRVVPLAETIMDRWEKANYLGFGKGSSVYDNSYVYGDVTVGKNTWVGPFTILDGTGKLKIGSNCSVSAGVHIYTHNTVDWAVSGGKAKYKYDETVIEDNCYIGPNSIIAQGVRIGRGSIIGANSFVNKSFDANSKIAGNPAKLIR